MSNITSKVSSNDDMPVKGEQQTRMSKKREIGIMHGQLKAYHVGLYFLSNSFFIKAAMSFERKKEGKLISSRVHFKKRRFKISKSFAEDRFKKAIVQEVII